MSGTFTIDRREIGAGQPPYIIAEMSGNHNGDIGRAFEIMAAVRDAGADAIKLQTYTADTLTIDHDGPGFQIEGGLWDGRTLHDLYQEAHTPWGWHESLFEKAHDLGITIFSSPFDATALELLERLDSPAYKIASFEMIDLPLIERVAQTGKPMIISTGLATEDEIDDAVHAAQKGGAAELALLHCVSGYPALPEDYNLRTMAAIEERWNVPVGLSDHTPGIEVAIAAAALGCCIIEKHVTLRRADGGPDAAFSLEPDELAALCTGTRTAHTAIGAARFGPVESERGNVIFRRSLYAVADIAAGGTLTADNVRSIRPGHGLAPKHYHDVLGRRAARNITRGTPLDWTLIE